MTTLSPPPIPRTALLDGRGNLTPEWWRWLHSLFNTTAGQQVIIEIINNQITTVLSNSAIVDPPADPAEMLRLALRETVPADPPILSDAAKMALRGAVPPDPVDFSDILRKVLFYLWPSEPPVDPDQVAMRGLALAVPT